MAGVLDVVPRLDLQRTQEQAAGSGRLIGRILGTAHRTAFCTTVENSSAKTAPIPTLNAVGMPKPPGCGYQQTGTAQAGTRPCEHRDDSEPQ